MRKVRTAHYVVTAALQLGVYLLLDRALEQVTVLIARGLPVIVHCLCVVTPALQNHSAVQGAHLGWCSVLHGEEHVGANLRGTHAGGHTAHDCATGKHCWRSVGVGYSYVVNLEGKESVVLAVGVVLFLITLLL